MIVLKSRAELEAMHAANQIVATVRDELIGRVAAGVSTADLDRYAEARVRELGGEPAFKGYRGFPATLCTSLNEEIVHGIPSPDRKLAAGDIIGVDLGVRYQGFYGDSAVTIPVEPIDSEVRRLLDVTRESLELAIEECVEGNRVGDISHAVQSHVEAAGFSIVRDFVGHGVGASLHEEPQIPNFGVAGIGARLRSGMVLAIEPMVNLGSPEVELLDDGWTAVTADRRPSAHFEHSVAITEDGPWVLSSSPAASETRPETASDEPRTVTT